MRKIKVVACLILIISNLFVLTNPLQANTQKYIYLKPQFGRLIFCENGLIIYHKNGKFGFLSPDGKVLFDPILDCVDIICSEGNTELKLAPKIYKDFFVVWQNGKPGILDSNMKFILNIDNQYLVGAVAFMDIFLYEKDGKIGFINLRTKNIVKPQFDKINFISYGPFPTANCNGIVAVHGKYYLCALNGDFPDPKIPYLLVSKDGKCGAIDSYGNMFVDIKYKTFEEVLSNKKFAEVLQRQENKKVKNQSVLNKQNTEKKALEYISYEKINKNKYKLIFIKGSNKTKSKEVYENIKYIGLNNLIAVSKNKKWGIVDINGKFVVTPQFEDIKEFSEGLCAFKQNGRWGFMDKNFKIAIKPQYIQADSFFAHMSCVTTDNYIGLIDTKGNFIVKFPAKNSRFLIVNNVKYRDMCSSEFTMNSVGFRLFKYSTNLPKLGYVVIDNKTKTVGLVLKGQD
ncbi:KWG repeat protein [Caldicellulosiruptor acetigenus I77R1B]|uniref:KWG repeat protein n=1 Tax=Caldicellulosiruptor acetigenus (strain ATCC 700853 / DSM 12137 / I77R1B) TaxID=632335 RepID=E4S8F7_CALA7|nr:WG repeat-containing protein [Caldicellulosiruptor acetigenus]ADQ41939.1 KWG repeat protein [Caldicellulosiruptor acetigenus I77R1B]